MKAQVFRNPDSYEGEVWTNDLNNWLSKNPEIKILKLCIGVSGRHVWATVFYEEGAASPSTMRVQVISDAPSLAVELSKKLNLWLRAVSEDEVLSIDSAGTSSHFYYFILYDTGA